MNRNDLRRLDLNLLIVFETLMHERSVTRAAEKLFLGQPAISAALARLRTLFDDPLFVRSAYGLEPTARALTLQQQLHPILLSLDNLIQPPDFDPASTEREFVIASMDSAFTLFAPLYLSELKRQAPGIRLRYEEWTENSLTEMSQGQVDIAFTVRENCISSDFRLDTLPNAICQRLLTIDDLTCLVQRDHPALQEPEWDLARYLAERFDAPVTVQTFTVRPRGGADLQVQPVYPSGERTAAAIVPLAPLRAAAEAQGNGDFSPLWAGQGVALARATAHGLDATTLTQRLADDAHTWLRAQPAGVQ